MCKPNLGRVAFSPDSDRGFKHNILSPPPASDSLNVTNKTPDIVDDDLDIKDKENNQFQQEMLSSYLDEKRNLKATQSKIKTLDSNKDNNSSHYDISVDLACSNKDKCPTYNRRHQDSDNLVEYEMELIQFEENNISNQMTILEHRIREAESDGKERENLLNSWFELVSRKNIIFHRRLMIEILQNEQDLERRCEILQAELRMEDLDNQTEQLLLEELVRLVDLRDKLVSEKIDEEERLCQEEIIGKAVQYRKISQSSKCRIQ